MNTFKLALSSFLLVFFIACNNSSNSKEQVNEEASPVNITEENVPEVSTDAKPAPQDKIPVEEQVSPPTQVVNPPPPKIADEPKTAIRPRTENTFQKSTKPTPEVITQPESSQQESIVENKKPDSKVFNKPKRKEEKIVAETSTTTPKAQKVVLKQFNHDAWDQLLRANVSATGKVNYKGFKAQQAKLDAYLKQLADNPVQAAWSKNEKMAYWINAYNAFTIKLIVDNYPVKSIMDLHGGKPWDVKWIKLGTKTYSLNNIEHDILRPKYKDARIHFAVNCAAKSCPPVLNRAWTAANLNSNFQKQATSFINNSSFNKIAADKIQVSKIFEWYAVDFGNLINYLNKYSSTKINAGAKIEYLEYNWSLNE